MGFFINQFHPFIIMVNIKLSIEALESLLKYCHFPLRKIAVVNSTSKGKVCQQIRNLGHYLLA